jgi:hypothetical protein
MFNSAVLEVTVGVLVVFLLVSTVCTAIREGIEARLKTRAAYLEAGVRELLADVDGKGIARAFYNHPLIFSLFAGDYEPGAARRTTLESGRNLPSYISGRSFALALFDIVARGPSTDAASGSPDLPPVTLASLRQNVGDLGNPRLQRALLLAIDSAEGDIERARQNLQAWFDDGMGRVSGWYKRSTQKVIFVIAVAMVGGLNINTISIAQHLYKDDLARAALVASAEETTADGQLPAKDAALGKLLDADLPLGWDRGYGAPVAKAWGNRKSEFHFWNDIVGTVAGLLITVFAAMLGAPFWFDVLGRVTAIRATFKPPAPTAVSPGDQGTNPGNPNVGVPSRAPSPVGTPSPPPDDGDACDHAGPGTIADATSDEDLPAARGGVAS